MPWHRKTKKDVVSCDKLGGVANTLLSRDFRMEKSDGAYTPSLPTEYIGRQGYTQGSETSQYLKEKKSIEIALVVASECARA